MIQHKHLIVRAEIRKPPKPKEGWHVESWFVELVEGLGMRLLDGPHVRYVNAPGNRGITAVCIIETSHIAMHVWDEKDPALMQLDVYTCGALDPKVVFEALDVFEPVKIEYKYLDREHGLVEVASGPQSAKV